MSLASQSPRRGDRGPKWSQLVVAQPAVCVHCFMTSELIALIPVLIIVLLVLVALTELVKAIRGHE